MRGDVSGAIEILEIEPVHRSRTHQQHRCLRMDPAYVGHDGGAIQQRPHIDMRCAGGAVERHGPVGGCVDQRRALHPGLTQRQRRCRPETGQSRGHEFAGHDRRVKLGRDPGRIIGVACGPDRANPLAEGVHDGRRRKQHVEDHDDLAMQALAVQLLLLEQHVQAGHRLPLVS